MTALTHSIATLQTCAPPATAESPIPPPQREPKKPKAQAPKLYADAAGKPARPPTKDQAFTKMNHHKKKSTSPALFTPEYTKINSQVIVKTEGPAVDGVSNDMIVEAVNKAIPHQHFHFLGAWCSNQGTITL